MRDIIVGVIPARGGSKGVPGKNIRDLGQKPLLQYIFESARRSKYLRHLILSTDDDEIARVGKSIGIDVPFRRPKALASDTASLISVIKHALAYFDSIGVRADGIMSLQPTCPFLSTRSIDEAIELFIRTGCDSVTPVAEMTKGHPYITKRLKDDYKIEDFFTLPGGVDNSRRQVREKAYYLTGGFYLRSRALVESDNTDSHVLGRDSRAVVVREIEAVDINSDFDFRMAEIILERWGIE